MKSDKDSIYHWKDTVWKQHIWMEWEGEDKSWQCIVKYLWFDLIKNVS